MNNSIRILILEPNPDDLELVQHALKESGLHFEAEIVQTKELFEISLLNFQPEIILADFSLPALERCSAFRLKEKISPKTPFIIVSGAIGDENAVELIKSGVTDYVLKENLYQIGPKILRAINEAQAERKKEIAEALLKQQGEQLQNILNLSLDVIFTVDHHLNFVTLSPAAKLIFDFEPDELIGKNILDFIHQDDKEKANYAFADLHYGIDIINLESRFVRRSGNAITILWSARWHTDNLGYGIAKEITEIKKAKEKLTRSEKRFRALLQNSTDGLTLITEDGSVIERSRAALKILGLTPEEATSSFRLDLVHPDDLEAAVSAFEAVKKDPDVIKITEYRMLMLDGTYKWIETTFQNQLAEPAVNAIVLNFRDINERKLTEVALKKNEVILKKGEEIAHLGNWYVDFKDGRIYWSDEAFRLFGLTPGEVEPTLELYLSFIHPEDFELVKQAVDAVTFDPEGVNYDYRVICKDGTIKYLHSSNKLVSDPKTGDSMLFGVLMDITNQKLFEERLLQSEARLIEAQAIGKIGNWEIDFSTGISEWSDAIFQMYGLDKENTKASEELYKTLVHPDDLAQIYEKVNASQENLETGSTFFRYFHSNGELRYAFSEWRYKIDQYGKPLAIYGIQQDVTDQKLVEKRLLHSRARLKQAQTIGKIGNWEVNYQNGTTECSDEIYNILGLSTDKIALDPEMFFSFVHPDEKATVINKVSLTRITRESGSIYYRFFRADGELRYGYSEWRYEIDKNGNLISVFGILQDITDKKKSEVALEESEGKYRNLFHLSPLPMWVFDPETYRFLDVNEAAIKHYGYSQAEFLNMTIKEIRPQEEIASMESIINSVISSNQAFKGIVNHQKKNGEIIQVDLQSNFLDLGSRKGRLVLAADISERIRHVRAIERQNTKLREIAWLQSHVVRAPLARMMGLISLIKTNYTEGANTSELMNYLLTSANELDTVIRDIVKETDNI